MSLDSMPDPIHSKATLPVALIPAYNPENSLVPLVAELVRGGAFAAVVVVDDGSAATCLPFFDAVATMDGVLVLRHAINLGKGMALRTAMNHIACNFPHAAGIVTLDADGQHLPHDVCAVAEALRSHPGELIMGCRKFDGEVPLRSRLGNSFTRRVMWLLVGIRLSDTQTGLRGIPMSLVPVLLRLRTTGYDFELDMLVACKQRGVVVREVPIETVYLNENASSHFHPLRDSMKIYIVFLRFNLSALLAVLIDYTVFSICFLGGMGVGWALVLARVFSGGINFLTNKQFVFKSNANLTRSFGQYVAIVVAFGTVVYFGVNLMNEILMVPVLVGKIFMELLLYIASFTIQREVIFKARSRT